jgi:hypothetical protein
MTPALFTDQRLPETSAKLWLLNPEANSMPSARASIAVVMIALHRELGMVFQTGRRAVLGGLAKPDERAALRSDVKAGRVLVQWFEKIRDILAVHKWITTYVCLPFGSAVCLMLPHVGLTTLPRTSLRSHCVTSDLPRWLETMHSLNHTLTHSTCAVCPSQKWAF